VLTSDRAYVALSSGTHILKNRKITRLIHCLILAVCFLALGMLSYRLRNDGLGNELTGLSTLLGSAPSLFHGAFFLALVSAFDPKSRKLESNAIICIVISTILEILGVRIWWTADSGIEFWKGVTDINDIICGFLGVGLSFVILKWLSKKKFEGDD